MKLTIEKLSDETVQDETIRAIGCMCGPEADCSPEADYSCSPDATRLDCDPEGCVYEPDAVETES